MTDMMAWTLDPGSCTPPIELRRECKQTTKKNTSTSQISHQISEDQNVHVTRKYSQVEYPMSTMKLSHMNFVRSPKIIYGRKMNLRNWNKSSSHRCEKRRAAVLHLLYHDDVRAEHFKAPGEEHDVAPAQDQAERHHDGLALHLAGPEHTQQHHQAGVADAGRRRKTKRLTPDVSDRTGLFYSL